MSKYRDDKQAAQYRIDALEDKLGEHKRELAARDEKLAEQEDEIRRLRRELREGPTLHRVPVRRPGVVIATLGLAMMASMGAFSALRWVNTSVSTPIPMTPPALRFEPSVALSPRSADEAQEYAQRRVLEAKVWGGGDASIEDIRMLKALCAHAGDQGCRERASAELRLRQSSP